MDRVRSPDLHPSSLPPGAQIGPWRVVSWRGRGTYGAVYRAIMIGEEQAAPVALKVALHPGDPRFEREVALLSRIHHAHVPTLADHGEWPCAELGVYPYLAMQWVEGIPFYDWSEVHNPTSRQFMRLLAQVARALAATHKAHGVHRDMKGDNVLVCADGQAFLTDFGSGTYVGAKLLTYDPLPPGTPTYRSPEAWRYGLSARERDAHYDAKPTDDIFALGVTAYRLATDEYPTPTDPGLEESRLWYSDGVGLRPPLELNPRVDPQLSAIILRMLSISPEARGSAEGLAEQLEQRAEQAGPEADQRLFAWETLARSEWPREERANAYSSHQRLRHRVQEQVSATEQKEVLSKSTTPPKQVVPPVDAEEGSPGLTATAAVLLVVLGGWWVLSWTPDERSRVARADDKDAGKADGGTTELGEEALTMAVKETGSTEGQPGLHKDLPLKPLPGQRRPDNAGRCRNPAHVVINGGCWQEFVNMKPPCDDEAYEWRGGCYDPVFPAPRQPASTPPKHRTP